jgi:hypothetical protein
VLALRHDTFKPQLAGVPKYGLAVFLDVVVRGCDRICTIPLLSQTTASPSMMQDRERSRATDFLFPAP